MQKYEPLYRFLHRRRHGGAVTLRFDEIERILGACLPKAAVSAHWWSNEPATGRQTVQCDAWLKAHYEACLLGKEVVEFRRIRPAAEGLMASPHRQAARRD